MIGFLIAALSTSAVLVPLVASVSLVFRVSGVVNFGAGYVAVFASAACAAWSADLGNIAGALLTLLIGALIGVFTYFVAILPAQRRGVSPVGLTLASLGVGLLLNYGNRQLFGGDPTVVQPWWPGSVTIFGYGTAAQRLLVIGLAIVLLVILWFVFERTLMGRTLTAVAYDRELSSMYGVRAIRFELIAWISSSVCLVIGGLFQASLASVSVDVSPTLLVFSLVGAVVGGLDNMFTAVGGGVVAGIAVTATDQWLAPGYQLAALFVVLTVVLLLRPRGLFAFRGSSERV